MSISPNTQCCHSFTIMCYSKTGVFDDPANSVIVIIFRNKYNYLNDARPFCLDIYIYECVCVCLHMCVFNINFSGYISRNQFTSTWYMFQIIFHNPYQM